MHPIFVERSRHRSVGSSASVLTLAIVCALSIAGAGCGSCRRSDAAEEGSRPAASASTSPSPSGVGAVAKSFGSFCTTDGDCASGTCFHKRLKEGRDAGREVRGADEAVEESGYCSMKCNSDADCPSPPTSGRCGARGMCKRP
jgi:hypothetical protein